MLMQDLVRSNVRGLKSLRFTCFTDMLDVEAILRHGMTLESLTIRDFTGFGDENIRCPTMAVGDVMRLADGLPQLRDIELDMDTALIDPTHFVQALGRFKNLHSMTLHVQTVIDPNEPIPQDTDPDKNAVAALMWNMWTSQAPGKPLYRGDSGQRWRMETHHGTPAWRSLAQNERASDIC